MPTQSGCKKGPTCHVRTQPTKPAPGLNSAWGCNLSLKREPPNSAFKPGSPRALPAVALPRQSSPRPFTWTRRKKCQPAHEVRLAHFNPMNHVSRILQPGPASTGSGRSGPGWPPVPDATPNRIRLSEMPGLLTHDTPLCLRPRPGSPNSTKLFKVPPAGPRTVAAAPVRGADCRRTSRFLRNRPRQPHLAKGIANSHLTRKPDKPPSEMQKAQPVSGLSSFTSCPAAFQPSTSTLYPGGAAPSACRPSDFS